MFNIYTKYCLQEVRLCLYVGMGVAGGEVGGKGGGSGKHLLFSFCRSVVFVATLIFCRA